MAKQEADRDATRGSLLHQFDLELREVRNFLEISLAVSSNPRARVSTNFSRQKRTNRAVGIFQALPAACIAQTSRHDALLARTSCAHDVLDAAIQHKCNNLYPPPYAGNHSLTQSVKRVAKRAADARLPSDVLREVMQACSASRKNAMRRAKAAGYQSRAREASRSDTNQKKGGRGAGRGGTPVPSTGIPLLEHFVLEFEEVVSNVEGIEVPVRQSLVIAARVLA